jgi:argininosuccinate lyase
MRLWQGQNNALHSAVLTFTVGQDPVLDRQLLPFDCIASAAHAMMLGEIGVLEHSELNTLQEALRKAYAEAVAGRFEITQEDEDCHTALENFLVREAGEPGKKIHTGRSRNDQVIMAARLWLRSRLCALADTMGEVVDLFLDKGEEHARTLMPGYTHTRQAMPSSVGQFFFSVAEGLILELETLQSPLHLAHRSALGSASGYGVPLSLNRQKVADLLGLGGVDINTIHVQNTRGRLEASAVYSMHQISIALSRFATDLIWFSSEPFKFFILPDTLTTGSSIMPQKRNPDLFELLRATPASLLGRYTEITGLLHGLPGGYHRDLQRTKGPMIHALDDIQNALQIVAHAVDTIEVDEQACRSAIGEDIFATDQAYGYVRQGMSFRDAYRKTKEETGTRPQEQDIWAARLHLGAPGTNHKSQLEDRLEQAHEKLTPYKTGAKQAEKLLSDQK